MGLIKHQRVLLTADSRKFQDKYGTKNILEKQAVTDHIQECLDTVRDIKVCNRQDMMMEKLDQRLCNAEKSAIHSELAADVFVSSAQAFLRLGLATTVLTGAGMLASGELDFLYFSGFLFAASRLYDPLGLVLQNIAATFAAKLNIDQMRTIQEQPIQTGADQVVALDGGSVAERGTPGELLAGEGGVCSDGKVQDESREWVLA